MLSICEPLGVATSLAEEETLTEMLGGCVSLPDVDGEGGAEADGVAATEGKLVFVKLSTAVMLTAALEEPMALDDALTLAVMLSDSATLADIETVALVLPQLVKLIETDADEETVVQPDAVLQADVDGDAPVDPLTDSDDIPLVDAHAVALSDALD